MVNYVEIGVVVPDAALACQLVSCSPMVQANEGSAFCGLGSAIQER